jgi:hypothetical protein
MSSMQRVALILMALVAYLAVVRELAGLVLLTTPLLLAAILGPLLLGAIVASWIWRGRG